MSLQFKPLAIAGLEFVLQSFKQAAEKIARKKVDHWQYWHQPPEEKISWVKDGLRKNEFYTIVLSRTPVGIIRILNQDYVYWDREQNKDRSLYIHSLIVFDTYNGQGLGEKAIQAVEQRAKQEERKYLRLDCDAKNKSLCSYYEKQGFQKIIQREFPHSINNLYQKNISPASK